MVRNESNIWIQGSGIEISSDRAKIFDLRGLWWLSRVDITSGKMKSKMGRFE